MLMSVENGFRSVLCRAADFPVSVPSETRAQCALGAVEVFFFMPPRRIAIFGFVPLFRVAEPSERSVTGEWSVSVGFAVTLKNVLRAWSIHTRICAVDGNLA